MLSEKLTKTLTKVFTAGSRKKAAVVILLFLIMTAFLAVPVSGTPADDAKWPKEPNISVLWYSGKLQADMSNASEGYFLARLNAPNKHKMKLRVTKGGTTLTYNLNGSGEFEIFPFQLGSGYYDVSLFENVSGKKYAAAGTLALNVNLNSDNVPFLYPNQYVNYTRFSESVIQAEQLSKGLGDAEKFKVLCDYMTKNFLYDYVKAVTIKAGQLPDVDGSYKKKMGVCQDLSAILCSMLRTQGLPARLIIGYADKQYHAWTVTVVNGKEYFFDPTAAIGGISKVIDYSVERYY